MPTMFKFCLFVIELLIKLYFSIKVIVRDGVELDCIRCF